MTAHEADRQNNESSKHVEEAIMDEGDDKGNPYQDERVSQICHCPKDWAVPGIDELKKRITEIFGDIDLSHVAESITAPMSADGTALIPKIAYLGKHWGIENPYGSGYCQIVFNVLVLIENSRKLFSYREGQMSQDFIRLHEEVKRLLKQKEGETSGDVLAVPISFGNLYAGYSVRNARWEALHSSQLPLGSAQVGCLLLMMPERLVERGNLHIDCPADDYNWSADGNWSYCSHYYFDGDEVRFDAGRSGYADGNWGSAVAFLEA